MSSIDKYFQISVLSLFLHLMQSSKQPKRMTGKRNNLLHCIRRSSLNSNPSRTRLLPKIQIQISIFRCSIVALVCMATDGLCMVLYLFMMNYFPINLTNSIYLIDSNINIISLIMIQKNWKLVLFPWRKEKTLFRKALVF